MLDKLKALVGLAPRPEDAAEWDANDPAGDPFLYSGDAVAEAPYDHKQFVQVKK